MTNRNTFIWKALQVVAWIIFVGLCIEAGALVVNFVMSIFNPSIVKHLYEKLDLSEVYKQSTFIYFGMYSFVISIALMKSILFYHVIHLMQKMDIQNPFNEFVSKKISTISYYTFGIGLVSFIAKTMCTHFANQGFRVEPLGKFWLDSGAFIVMSAVIYIIALIFKKGIELQHENDLTV